MKLATAGARPLDDWSAKVDTAQAVCYTVLSQERMMRGDPRAGGVAAFFLFVAGTTGTSREADLTQVDAVPQFGRQRVQILDPGHVIVHATSETIQAEKGEDLTTFLQRLATANGVGPADAVDVIFKAGAPQYAIIEWGKGGCQG